MSDADLIALRQKNKHQLDRAYELLAAAIAEAWRPRAVFTDQRTA